MAKNTQTSKKVKFKGTVEFIDKATGELIPMQVSEIEERDFNFHKVWLQYFINTLDIVGNQKTRLCYWIIEHLDKENKLTMTYRQISQYSGVSLDTVQQTMSMLIESDFLRRYNRGCYIINPDVIFKGTRNGRLNVLTMYHGAEPSPIITPQEKINNLQKTITKLQQTIYELQNGEVKGEQSEQSLPLTNDDRHTA